MRGTGWTQDGPIRIRFPCVPFQGFNTDKLPLQQDPATLRERSAFPAGISCSSKGVLGALFRKFRCLFFLVAIPGIVGHPVAGHAGSGKEPLPAGWRGADALAAIALLPDGEVPLGKTLVMASSLWGEDLTGVPVDPAVIEGEIDRLAERVRPALRDRSDPRKVISTLNRFLYVEEGYTYDSDAGNPENYLLDRVIARKRGNCLGLTSLYLLMAERLSIPLRGVYVPSHSFVRYEDGRVRFNIETGDKGADWQDGRYVRDFRLTGNRPYLRSLGRKEMIGVYLKSLGTAYSREGREGHALRLYRGAAVFYPALPDAYFNAGVSLHRNGFLDEAIVQYRRALDLDPDLAVARDNITVAQAKKGRFGEALEEARKAAALRPRNPSTLANLAAALCANGMLEDGIRVYRTVLGIDPDNTRALAGLTKAHFSLGQFHEAIVTCDRAVDRGWKPDPGMVGILESYRDHSEDSLP
jgi:tetratricopeptide (TPR) repeat protein